VVKDVKGHKCGSTQMRKTEQNKLSESGRHWNHVQATLL